MSTQNILNRLGGSTAPVKPTDQNAADTDNKALGPLLDNNGNPVTPQTQPEDAGNKVTPDQLDQGLAGVTEVGVAGSVAKPVLEHFNFDIVQEVPTTTTRRGPRSEEQARAEDSGEIQAEVIKPVGAYKHRSVRHFVVGGFEFKNNVLLIYTAEANERFLDLYDQLEERDKNAIVEYDWEAAQRVEQPVMVARGAMASSRIKDAKVIKS